MERAGQGTVTGGWVPSLGLACSKLNSGIKAGEVPEGLVVPVWPGGTHIWVTLAFGSGATIHAEILVLLWLVPTPSYGCEIMQIAYFL